MRVADLVPVWLWLPAIPVIAIVLAPEPPAIERLPQPVKEEVWIEVMPPPPPAPPKPDETVHACP